jgi:hypothetical protein
MFLDERGTGLRVSWHPERDLVVLSVWQDDRCVGTFRMSVQDVPRLSGLLAAALGDWVDQTGPFPGTEDPQPVGPGSGGPRADASGTGFAEAGGPGAGGPGPGTGGPESGLGGPESGLGWPGTGVGGGGFSLSMQQRVRLSRPVLRLRGLQHRRRRSG